MSAEPKIIPLIDETGNKLPKNLGKQFRDVQSNVEHIKINSDEMFVEIKKVSKKLGKNTTDLSLITQKINTIELNQKNHIEVTVKALSQLEKLSEASTVQNEMTDRMINSLGSLIELAKSNARRIWELEKK